MSDYLNTGYDISEPYARKMIELAHSTYRSRPVQEKQTKQPREVVPCHISMINLAVIKP